MKAIIGTAGWSIATREAEHFPGEGSALERYVARFPGVEINSSFHRPHRKSTWERWGSVVPDDFRFSVKLPKTITHKQKLVDCEELLPPFLDEASGLGGKLAVLLVQLPPSLAFDAEIAESFFALLRDGSPAAIACEPRHLSWFERDAGALSRCKSRESPPIRRACLRRHCRAAGGASAIFGCTDRRSSTGPATMHTGSKPMRNR
jgi:uncharacterized protein YecE (DUF72 family)